MATLQINNVSFAYQEHVLIIKDFNFLVEESQKSFFILGDNGSGKSTFGKLITGLLRPNKGTILINEKQISNLPISVRIKNAQYTGQKAKIQFSQETLLKEISLVEKVSKNIFEIDSLQYFYLPNNFDISPFDLTKNESWRFLLLLADLQDTEVLFIDELPSGSNPINLKTLSYLIDKRKSKGKITFVSYQRMIPGDYDKVIYL